MSSKRHKSTSLTNLLEKWQFSEVTVWHKNKASKSAPWVFFYKMNFRSITHGRNTLLLSFPCAMHHELKARQNTSNKINFKTNLSFVTKCLWKVQQQHRKKCTSSTRLKQKVCFRAVSFLPSVWYHYLQTATHQGRKDSRTPLPVLTSIVAVQTQLHTNKNFPTPTPIKFFETES